jgi:NAD(P)H dehydrogenase (quinone)
MQMGQIWVGTGLLPASRKSNTPADVNWSSGFGRAHAISPADATVGEARRIGDLETARLFGKRIAELSKETELIE